MTQPIQEPMTQRSISSLRWGESQLYRRPRPPSGGQYPICFRAKMTPITDAETHTYHYISGDEGNNVFWNSWDPDYDTSIYTLAGGYISNDFGYDMIAGVGLKALGIYSIHAIVDLQEVFAGTSLFKSNYDEGQGEFRYHNNIAPGGDPYWGDLYGIRLDHWRQVVDIPPPDHLWGGEATTVEIVLSVNTAIDVGGATGGVFGGSPGDDMWIPGGYDGAWGLVPNMIVMYWGPVMNLDPDWPADGLPP